MIRHGVAFAGNLIVDRIRKIDHLPLRSELAMIHTINHSTGGVLNSAISLMMLDKQIPIDIYGVVGVDAEGDYILSELKKLGIRTSNVIRRGETSFTDVYEEMHFHCRTLFHYSGANDSFDANDVPYETLSHRIFHLAYPLLLKALDRPDPEYGTGVGQVLFYARQAGCLTSIDVVTEDSNRYESLVRPLLPYVDYLTVNELEAQRITGIQLTHSDGSIIPEHMPLALARLFDLGVNHQTVIHAPSGAFGMDAVGHYAQEPSKRLPAGYIKGTVGAGDAFCAGTLLAAYRGLTVSDALRFGNASALQSLQAETANGAMTSIDEALAHYDYLVSED